MSRDTRLIKLVRTDWFWPAIVSFAAIVAAVAMLDPAGDHPGGRDGPGVTVDESFNVIQGVQLFDRLLSGDLAGFRTVDAQLPDHPPLGRLWIGLCHEVAFLIAPPKGTAAPYSVTCARTAPALAFAVTVFLVGWFTSRWCGPFAGGCAAAAVCLMPRTFGHAHLAALESCINLTYGAVVLYLADRWSRSGERSGGEATSSAAIADATGVALTIDPPKWGTAAVGGVLLGLALLTKIQAVLLPIPIALWAILAWRKRAMGLVLLWGLVGGLVFLVCWPYLWESPVAHVQKYLGRTTERAVIYVWYGGRAIADRDVPWHYPWVIWGTTIPIGLHLLGACGLWKCFGGGAIRSRGSLIFACLAFPMVVFSIPGVAVYDGERLFSVSFPLWAVLVGFGSEWLRNFLARRFPGMLSGMIVGGIVAAQAWGLIAMAPCWLSYYNVVAGGLRGADRHGLPVAYWGDSVVRELLDAVATHVPEQGIVAVAPVLHAGQWNEVVRQSPVLTAREIRFVPLGSPEAADCELLLFFNRREYLPEELRGPLDPDRLVASVRRDGVILAGLYRQR